jgi:hypothetical protein
MVAKAVGAKPQGPFTEAAAMLMWRIMRLRAGLNAKTPAERPATA